MELAVLGAAECRRDDGRAVVPARRDRALLAALAVDRRRVWTVDELSDAVWGEDPPAAAAKVIRNRVSELRGRIGHSLIESIGSGYRLGRTVVLDVDDIGQSTVPTGRPFVDVEEWPPAWPAIARLTDRLLSAQDAALAEALERGQVDDLVAMAEGLVAEQPLREIRWTLLVRALYAANRHRDALDAAARARRAFLDVGLPAPDGIEDVERSVLARIRGGDGPVERSALVAPRLIGRHADLQRIAVRLVAGGVVTLIGPGGVGKTALATLLASQADRVSFPDGAWMCDLAAVNQADDVAPALAACMGLRPDGGMASIDGLIEALRLQRCLVVLDNAEHVVDAVARVVAQLVRLASVGVLVTSREAIGIATEVVLPVQPLAPDDAVALFALRAKERGVTIDDQDPAVRVLCERLDRLPLAIELAAMRTSALSVPDLVDRLDDRLRLLRAERATDPRHRSLDAMVDWSCSLLDDVERTVFDRLSVLVGSFRLSDAEAVCSDDEVCPAEVTSAAASLVSKSMVVAEHDGRYRLLDTLRHVGARRLRAGGRARERALAHATHFAEVVVQARRGLRGADPARWCAVLDGAWDNVREAVTWSLRHDHLEIAATIATHSMWAALYHDRVEPYDWVEAVRVHPDADRLAARASVLGGAAWVAFERGNSDLALDLGEAALAAETAAHLNLDGFAQLALQSVVYLRGQLDDADRWIEHAAARARQDGDPILEVTTAAVGRAIVSLGRPDVAAALRHARTAVRLGRHSGNPTATSWALAWEAQARLAAGGRGALAVAETSAVLAEQARSWLPRSSAYRVAVLEHLAHDDWVEAARLAHHCLTTGRRRGGVLILSMHLALTVPVLVRAGQPARAATLLGAFAETPASHYPTVGPMVDSWCREIAEQLEGEAMEESMAEGATMPLADAAAVAEEALAAIIHRTAITGGRKSALRAGGDGAWRSNETA